MAAKIPFKERVAIAIYLESVKGRFTSDTTLTGRQLCFETRESLGLPVSNAAIYRVAKDTDQEWVREVAKRKAQPSRSTRRGLRSDGRRHASHDIRYMAKLLKAVIAELDSLRADLYGQGPLFSEERLKQLAVLAESHSARPQYPLTPSANGAAIDKQPA